MTEGNSQLGGCYAISRLAIGTAGRTLACLFLCLGLLSTAIVVDGTGNAVAASGATQWICSVSDQSSGCSSSNIAGWTSTSVVQSAVTAPCPESTDTCLYSLASDASVQAYDVVTNSWASSGSAPGCDQSLPACIPLALSSFVSAVASCPDSLDTCVYLLGGQSDAGVGDYFLAYDTSTNGWLGAPGDCSSGLPCLPTARTELAAVTAPCPRSLDECVYGLGGIDAQGDVLSTVEAFDPNTDSWVSSDSGGSCANAATLPCMPSGRKSGAAAVARCPLSQDWCVYAIGGSDAAGATATVQAYDSVSNSWSSSDAGSCESDSTPACLPTVLQGEAAATWECNGAPAGCLVVIGGRTAGGGEWPAVAVFDPQSDSWETVGAGNSCGPSTVSCMPTGRWNLSAAVSTCPLASDTCLYTLGGISSGGQAFHQVEAFDAGSGLGQDLFVSPGGLDTNPGTQYFPLRTLQRARNLVRSLAPSMAGPITVYLEDGTFRLSQPLWLSSRDSGRNGQDVIWTAAPGAYPVVSGATRVSGWHIASAARGIWAASVPSSLRTRQMFVNGMRAQLARGAIPVNLKATASGYVASATTMASWTNPKEIEFVYTGGMGQWSEPICPIASVVKRIITMAQPCWNNSTKRWANFVGPGTLLLGAQPSYVENAYALLDQPGEFYLDSVSHTLYYIPRQGEDMSTADVEVPVLQTILNGVGTAAHPVQNLEFSNLQFSYATWLQPGTPTGFSEIQANYTITGIHGYRRQGLCQFAPGGTCPYGAWTKEPGNVQFSYDRNVSFVGDRFIHLGAAGLNLDNGSQRDTVTGCVFTDVSGNGLELGNVNMPEAGRASQTSNDVVTDNHIYGLPAEYHGGVGIDVGYAADTRIAHNQIDHTSYTAISMGWGGWPDKIKHPATTNFSHNNVVSQNLIFDDMQVLNDGGAIYTQGLTGRSLATGEKVTGNVIHDQLDWGHALYTDNGGTFITYTGNVTYNDTYDWAYKHVDYGAGGSTDDPQLVQGNYWQQGDKDGSNKGVTVRGNNLISGPNDVPAGVMASAGLEPEKISLLGWQSSGESVPLAPERVSLLYAFGGKAYVTWRPSFAAGNSPVTSYTVTSCRVRYRAARCLNAGGPPVTISAAQFDSTGYVVYPGLTDGQGYTFAVSANTGLGSSTPSTPSADVTPSDATPAPPGPPRAVSARAGHGVVKLQWFAPSNTSGGPVLGYLVVSSQGSQYTSAGHSQLIISNGGGHALHVFGNLTPGQAYTFTIAAVTPGGTGPAISSSSIAPS